MGQWGKLFVVVEKVSLVVQEDVCLIEKALKVVKHVGSLEVISARLIWPVDTSVPAAAAETIVERIVDRLVGLLQRITFAGTKPIAKEATDSHILAYSSSETSS